MVVQEKLEDHQFSLKVWVSRWGHVACARRGGVPAWKAGMQRRRLDAVGARRTYHRSVAGKGEKKKNLISVPATQLNSYVTSFLAGQPRAPGNAKCKPAASEGTAGEIPILPMFVAGRDTRTSNGCGWVWQYHVLGTLVSRPFHVVSILHFIQFASSRQKFRSIRDECKLNSIELKGDLQRQAFAVLILHLKLRSDDN